MTKNLLVKEDLNLKFAPISSERKQKKLKTFHTSPQKKSSVDYDSCLRLSKSPSVHAFQSYIQQILNGNLEAKSKLDNTCSIRRNSYKKGDFELNQLGENYVKSPTFQNNNNKFISDLNNVVILPKSNDSNENDDEFELMRFLEEIEKNKILEKEKEEINNSEEGDSILELEKFLQESNISNNNHNLLKEFNEATNDLSLCTSTSKMRKVESSLTESKITFTARTNLSKKKVSFAEKTIINYELKGDITKFHIFNEEGIELKRTYFFKQRSKTEKYQRPKGILIKKVESLFQNFNNNTKNIKKCAFKLNKSRYLDYEKTFSYKHRLNLSLTHKQIIESKPKVIVPIRFEKNEKLKKKYLERTKKLLNNIAMTNKKMKYISLNKNSRNMENSIYSNFQLNLDFLNLSSEANPNTNFKANLFDSMSLGSNFNRSVDNINLDINDSYQDSNYKPEIVRKKIKMLIVDKNTSKPNSQQIA